MAPLHTHSADGLIHVEYWRATTFTLGQFFDVWGQRLDGSHLMEFEGTVTALVDGIPSTLVRDIPLRDGGLVELSVA